MVPWFSHEQRRTPRPARSRRPAVEVLEDRCVPSVGSPFLIAGSAKNETGPATASSANGLTLVVWAREVSPDNHDIVAQFFDAASQKPVGSEFIVSNLSDDEITPDVATNADGNFVVVWERHLNSTGDDDIYFAL